MSAGLGRSTPDAAALEQAAQWFATLEADGVSTAQRAQWQDWMAASEGHRQAWARVLHVQQQFGAVAAQGLAEQALQAAAHGRSRRKALGLLGVVGATAALAWGGWRSWWTAADLRAGFGEIRDFELPDGTRIWLSSNTTVALHYTASERSLRLRGGELLVETAKDRTTPARPFVVHVGDLRMRALGTRFSLRLDDGATTLSVFEGAVEAAHTRGALQVVPTGRRLRLQGDGRMEEGEADAAREAWRDGLLLAGDMPLREVLAELGRFRPGHLGCDEAVAGLRVVGVFPLTDSDRALALLSQSLPIRLHAITPWWTMVRAR